MSNYIVNSDDLGTVADAIRQKSGSSAAMTFPEGFASQIQSIPTGSGGFTPTVLECTVDFANALEDSTELSVHFQPTLTSGTYADALAAAEAGTPAGLLVHLQQTETDPDTGESTTYQAGSVVVPLAFVGDDNVGGFMSLGEGGMIDASITSDGTVDFRLTVTTAEIGSGGDSAVYIDVTMEYLAVIQSRINEETTTISLPSGTYTTAAAAIASGRDVKVRLTLQHTLSESETPITVTQQTIPLRRVQLDTGAVLAANTAGEASAEDSTTTAEDETTTAEGSTTTTPDVSAYYSVVGDAELDIDLGGVISTGTTVSGNAPVSYVMPVPVRIVVQQDDTAEFAIQVDRWHLTVPVQLTALADDVNVGTEDSPQTVAAYKTQNAVDAVYRTVIYLDGQAQEDTAGMLALFALIAFFLYVDVSLSVAQMGNSNSSSSKGWRIPLDGSDFIAEGKLYRTRIESSLFLITEKAVTL